MKLYSRNDKIIINKNIDKIKNNSEIAKLLNLKPNIEEIKVHFDSIFEFLKNKDIIIYGGYAIHLYLNESIYDMKTSIPDIDLYSVDPVNDIIEITNFLKKKHNIKNIEAKEALHKGTFSLFVEFRNYIDLTYIPKEIFNKLKIQKKKNLKILHPSLVLFDLIKKFNDPLISYFKLEKDFKRFYKLNNDFKINDYFEKKSKNNIKLNYLDKKILNILENNIKNESMIITGIYCYHLFSNNSFKKIPFLEIISINYKNDVIYFFNLLKKELKNIKKVNYYPFFNYINKKTIFYKDNKIILIIYDNNNKCIPYLRKNKYNFSSYLYLLQITFYNYIYYDYSNQLILRDYSKNIFQNLIILKKNFFEKNKNITILDNTIYQQFSINCLGEGFSPLVQFIKNTNEKYNKKKLRKFLYKPSNFSLEKKNKIKFIYERIDGTPKY